MFGHKQIWAAIEIVAESCGMSLSALSKSAGLDPTSLNPSKRYHGSRERWPSTETLSRVLKAANMDMRAFADILDAQVENSSDEQQLSRRRAKRFPTILEGSIRLEPHGPRISCKIRDLSATGARIRLLKALVLPSEFELEIPGLGQCVKVRLIWNQSNTYGVMFLEELRQPPDWSGVSLLDLLQTLDDGNDLGVGSKDLAALRQGTPKQQKSRQKQRKLTSRKSG